MKTGRNVLSFTTAIIFLLTALGTQLAMAADPAGSTTSVWSPGKPLIILHDADLTHALKEVDAAALAVASQPEQVVDLLSYVIEGKQ